MFKRKYLLFILAIAPLFLLMAPDTASAQSYDTQDHEGCDFGYEFDYSLNLDELEWGSLVNCASWTTYYIRTDAYLYLKNVAEDWELEDQASNACYVSRSCSAIETIERPEWGEYAITYCFSAESTGSRWPYSCRYVYEDLP